RRRRRAWPVRSAIRQDRETTCGNPNSRRARRWRISDDPLLLLPRLHEESQLLLVLLHLRDGRPLAKEGPGRARLHAFAARGAAFRFPPWLIEIGDDARPMPAAGDVPRVRPLDLVADAHTARAHDAAVVVDAKLVMRDIDGQLWKLI